MRFVLTLLLLIAIQNIFAQSRIITGKISDSETKEPIAYALISLTNSQSTVSEENGSFSIEIPSNTQHPQLIVSYLNYKPDTLEIKKDIDNYHIFLSPVKTQLNEVVITGVSKATLVKENPVPVIAISAKALQNTVESNIIDAMVKNAPGLNAVKTGPNISKPFIRGLGYNRVLTLYDGVRQEGQQWGDEHGIEVDAYNIERAEVIKGPASIMYGSDAMAGVISFIPPVPQEKDTSIGGKIISEYQSNNGLIGIGGRAGLQRQHFTFAIRGSYRLAKNYTNKAEGRIYNTGFQEKNGSLYVGYSGAKGYSNTNFTVYDNFQGIPDGSRDSKSYQFTEQIMESENDNESSRKIVSKKKLNSYALSALHQHIQHRRIYNNSQYNFKGGSITALLALQQSIRREYNHPTVPDQAGLFVRLNTLNYGIRFNPGTIRNIDATVGINGMVQNNKNKNGTDFPIPDFKLFDIGGFVFSKWKHKKWTVSGGVRYDIRKLSGENFYVRKNNFTSFEEHAVLPDTAGAKLQFPLLQQVFQGTSCSIGATYFISEKFSLKANVARGYRAPNISEIASNGLDPGAKIVYIGNRNFVPEFNLQEDIGITCTFKNISCNINLFNNTVQNYIYLSQLADENGNPVVIVPGNKTFTYKQSSANLHGLEYSFDLHDFNALKGFHFNQNFSYVLGKNKGKEFTGKGVAGEYLPFIPPVKMLSTFMQRISIAGSSFKFVSIKLEVDYNAHQKKYLALYNTETYTPSYTLINTGLSSEIKYHQNLFAELQLQVNNVFDTVYQSNLSRLKYFGISGMGRNICVRLVVPF